MKDTFFGKMLLGVMYICIALVVLFALFFTLSREQNASIEVYIKGEKITAVVADTPKLQEKGLSGRIQLFKNEGMLFIFESPGLYGFWMKDMLFPIDIIWLDEERKIVDMWQSATPESYPKVHKPLVDAKYVLEVNAGYANEKMLKLGDTIEFETL